MSFTDLEQSRSLPARPGFTARLSRSAHKGTFPTNQFAAQSKIPNGTRPLKLQASLEEDDQTGSEEIEPTTPVSETHSDLIENRQIGTSSNGTPTIQRIRQPSIVHTAATPPASPHGPPTSSPDFSKGSSSAGTRPAVKKTASSAIRSLFRRSNSTAPDEYTDKSRPSSKSSEGESPSQLKAHRQPSWSISEDTSAADLSVANDPPTSGSPTHQDSMLAPHVVEEYPKPNRASTGLSLKIIGFSTASKQQRPQERVRSTSSSSIHENRPTSSPFSLHAVEGAGLKARRMSANLPEEFHVDTCELDDEFASASKIPGRRKEIGKGATATVKIMVRRGDGKTQYAVKEFRKPTTKEDEAEYIRKVKSEFTIAKSLHHPNIVKTVRLCTHAGRWNHVMEYCQSGELYSLVERKYLQQEDKLCFFKQVLRGVAYLHENGIAHRDIKLENLLLTDEGHVKITDFGVSEVFCGEHPGFRSANGQCGKNMQECRKSAPGICGSLPYIAPEVLAKKGEYDPRPLDIWSCAILYLTLFHGGNAWQKADRSDSQYQRFMRGWDEFLLRFDDTIDENDYPPTDSCGPVVALLPTPGQRRLILKMLHPEPAKRITIKDVLKDRVIKNIDCCSPEADDDGGPIGIDVASAGSCKIAAKMKVQKKHHHLPPPMKRLPQHKFDMGDGTSRYD